MSLYLIRHPQPIDAEGNCYGRRDIGVDPGVLAVAAASIREQLPIDLLSQATVFTSPLSRCRLLANALTAPGSPTIDDDLIEIDFGGWEGTPWASVPRGELDAWAADLWGYAPGGGESAGAVAQRWQRWSKRIRAIGTRAVIAVTHAGFIRVALACQARLDIQEFAGTSIAFGSIHRIELETFTAEACALS